MTRRGGAKRGALLGLSCSSILFVADLTGVFLARGSLFDPQLEAIYLILVAATSTLIVGTVLGSVIGSLWPPGRALHLQRRTWLVVCCIVIAATVILSYETRISRRLPELPRRPPVTASRPVPILWVVIDTLRADKLYGPKHDFPLTPQLREFAQEATVFSDAEATAGWTIPSMASLFTGMHVETMRAVRVLPDWAPTAAERLRAAGYQTHAVVDNGLLETRNGYAAGFESWFQKSGMRFVFTLPGFRLLQSWTRRKLREYWPVNYYGAPRLTDAALERLASSTDAPLFLYVHYMDPHYPYYLHPELGADSASSEAVTLPWATLRAQGGTLRPGQLEFLTTRYANEIRHTDRELGRLLAAWRKRFGGESLIIITADHGEEFMDHDFLGHGNSLYHELVHVPLLMKLPAESVDSPPARIEQPVSLVDLLPTVLDTVGVRPSEEEPKMQGRSLLPWLKGLEAAPTRALIGWQNFRKRFVQRRREGSWSWLETKKDGKTKTELFDKATDYREQNNLASTRSEIAKAIAARAKAPIDSSGSPRGDSDDTHPNEDALRALGYVQ